MALEPGHRLVHHHHAGRIDIVTVGEVASLEERKAHGAEETGSHDIRVDLDPVRLTLGWGFLGNDEGEDDATEGDAGGPGRGADPGKRTHALERLAVQRASPVVVAVSKLGVI